MQLHAMSLCTIRSISFPFGNIGAQSSISWKNTVMKVKLCKVYTLECQQGDEIASGTIKYASLILQKGRQWE